MNTIINRMPDREDFLCGKYTIETPYPWLTYGAIMTIELLVKPEHMVLESGCGGSTIFFSERCKSVRSFETDWRWSKRVRSLLSPDSNITLICGEPEEILPLAGREPDDHYDWIVVDSADFGDLYAFRRSMMDTFAPKLKKGGFMVVDNYDRGHLKTFDYTGWDVYTFDDPKYVGRGTRICIKL